MKEGYEVAERTCSKCGCADMFRLHVGDLCDDCYHDNVNHPEHYTKGGIECIDAIRAMLTPEEFRGMLKGNATKYIWRERHKAGTESLKKAVWYLRLLIDIDEGKR